MWCKVVLTLRWWHGIVPALQCPRSVLLSSSHPPGCSWWQIPPQWCSYSPGWTHCVWNVIGDYSSQPQSLQSTQLKTNKQKTHCFQILTLRFIEGVTYAISHSRRRSLSREASKKPLKPRKCPPSVSVVASEPEPLTLVLRPHCQIPTPVDSPAGWMTAWCATLLQCKRLSHS